jgi:hypothetical protein
MMNRTIKTVTAARVPKEFSLKDDTGAARSADLYLEFHVARFCSRLATTWH